MKRRISVQDKLEADQYVTIAERNKLFNKLSIFFANSPDDFDDGSLETQIYAAGLSIDITPYMSLMGGYSFYEDDTDIDVDSAPFFGLPLNHSTLQTLLSGGE